MKLKRLKVTATLIIVAAATVISLAGFTSSSYAATPTQASSDELIHPIIKYLGKYSPHVHFSCQTPLAAQRCFGPQDFYKAYDISPLLNAGITGKGRTIAIIDFNQDPTIKHDLHVFDQYFGLPDPILNIFPRETTAMPINPSYAAETTLDVELAHAIAPGATINLILSTGQAEDVAKATAFVVDNNLGDVLSQSYGLGETDNPAFVQALHQSFLQATKKNITLLASSGDTGAAVVTAINRNGKIEQFARLGVAYPESDPLVTSVGGTTLYVNAKGQYRTETAWNNSSYFSPLGTYNATGGGFSAFFPQPAYQNNIPGIGHYRGVPDVSYNAFSNAIITCSSCGKGVDRMFLAGGTSAGSPQWAGIVALADQVAGKRLGFLNPILYRIGTSPEYGTSFHDTQIGNNTYAYTNKGTPGEIPGYSTQPGWDAATGWGSPDVAHLVPQLRRQDS